MTDLNNCVVHFEIGATDPERASKFYTSVFGWEIKKWDSPDMEYWMIMTNSEPTKGAINGGITRTKSDAPQSETPNSYVNVIEVENVDETIIKIKENGGTVTTKPIDMPKVGRLAYCTDTESNHFGIITSES